MESYAPVVPRPAKSNLPVILSGLATTVLALLGVYLLDVVTDEFHIMGWYADYLIPVGAMLVGAVAASGYGIASWVSGVKITKSLLWIVLGLLFVGYVAAEYIQFSSLHLAYRDGTPVGFFTYYDAVARSFAWRHEGGKPGDPLGGWGYCFRLLEVIGFCMGGVLVPFLLGKTPYCESCQVYMRTKSLGLIPASVVPRKIKKADTAGQAAFKEENDKAFADAQTKVAALRQFATDGKTPPLQAELQQLAPGKKAAAKLPQRIEVRLVGCRQCFAGHLTARLLTGQGKQQKTTELGTSAAARDFVRSMQQKGRGTD